MIFSRTQVSVLAATLVLVGRWFHRNPDAGGPPAIYFSLDDPDERLRLGADPVRRLDHGTRLVILDEVQKHPGCWTP